jgi:hypothetical protein
MQETGSKKSRRRRLGDAHRQQLQTIVDRLGQTATAEKLGLSAQTVAVLAAGFTANGSTVDLIERKLAEVGSEVP